MGGMTKPLVPPQVAANINKQLQASKSKVRLEEFIANLNDEFGGSREVCRKMVAEFSAGKPGSLSRAKILDAYVRLISLNSKKEEVAAVGELTDEQLNQKAIEYAEMALKSVPIVETPNGSPTI